MARSSSEYNQPYIRGAHSAFRRSDPYTRIHALHLVNPLRGAAAPTSTPARPESTAWGAACWVALPFPRRQPSLFVLVGCQSLVGCLFLVRCSMLCLFVNAHPMARSRAVIPRRIFASRQVARRCRRPGRCGSGRVGPPVGEDYSLCPVHLRQRHRNPGDRGRHGPASRARIAFATVNRTCRPEERKL